MAHFAITVRQLVPTRRLRNQANNPRGVYDLTADSEETALEQFHRQTPIADPEDFQVRITRLTPQ